MKIMIAIFFVTIMYCGISAQETRIEIISPSSEYDTKPNSDSVPDFYAINGQFQNIVILRCKYTVDLLESLERFVKQNAIRNAVILSAIGSVRSYHFHVVSNRTFPYKNVFVKNPTSPADITNMSGYIIDGRVHAHITLSNSHKAFGGHLERGTTVFTFAIVTIGILKDEVDIHTVDDKTYR